MCSELGGLSLRAAPRNHPQSHGSVAQSQRTSRGQLLAILYQVEHNTGLKIDFNHALYPWGAKLIGFSLVHSDGHTFYYRRWHKNYDSGLCHFAEKISAKVIGEKVGRKSDIPWKPYIWLGRDTEADEIIIAIDIGAVDVHTVRRNAPSQQWLSDPIQDLQALPWVLPRALTVTGTARPHQDWRLHRFLDTDTLFASGCEDNVATQHLNSVCEFLEQPVRWESIAVFQSARYDMDAIAKLT